MNCAARLLQFAALNNHMNAIGLLKKDATLGSLIIEAAYENRVPAGDALAVERVGFNQTITEALDNHQYHPHQRGRRETPGRRSYYFRPDR